MSSAALRAASHAITNQGNVRDHNEDACLDAGERGLWVVADGMGGHQQGDYASQLIVERLGKLPEFERPSEFVDRVEDALMGVNGELFARSSASEEPIIIGSTVVALLAFDRFALVTWAGDSRAYRLRDGELEQVSRDHSEVQGLVDQGLVKAEEAELHPQANVITRAVGGAEALYLDFALRQIEPGDRYLLCSDGLFKDVTHDEMREQLANGTCERSASALIELALSRECKDNVTVLVVEFAEHTLVPGTAPDEAEDDAADAETTEVDTAR